MSAFLFPSRRHIFTVLILVKHAHLQGNPATSFKPAYDTIAAQHDPALLAEKRLKSLYIEKGANQEMGSGPIQYDKETIPGHIKKVSYVHGNTNEQAKKSEGERDHLGILLSDPQTRGAHLRTDVHDYGTRDAEHRNLQNRSPWRYSPECFDFSANRLQMLKSSAKRCSASKSIKIKEGSPPLNWIVADPGRNVVVTIIPKVSSSSIRTVLNARCRDREKEKPRCNEFRANSALSHEVDLGQSFRAVLFRDPFDRIRSAWYNMNENVHIRSFFKHNGCASRESCSLKRFVELLQRRWAVVGDPSSSSGFNEHFVPQAYIAQIERMDYHFMGYMNDPEHLHIFWTTILNSTMVVKNQGNIPRLPEEEAAIVNRIVQELYRDDYIMLRGLGFKVASDQHMHLGDNGQLRSGT